MFLWRTLKPSTLLSVLENSRRAPESEAPTTTTPGPKQGYGSTATPSRSGPEREG